MQYIKYDINPKKAYEYLSTAKKNYEDRNDTFGIGYLGSYMGLTLERLNRKKEAEAAFAESLKILKNENSDYLLADALNNASEYYFRQKSKFCKTFYPI